MDKYQELSTKRIWVKPQLKEIEFMQPLVSTEELWNVYKDAVGGKAYDGKDMPEFGGIAESALTGWLAIAAHVNIKHKLTVNPPDIEEVI